MRIELDDLLGAQIQALLNEHLRNMYEITPAESVHALDLERLRSPDIGFWTAWQESQLVGCGALKELDPRHGEIKSMRTPQALRRRGAAERLGQLIATSACTAGAFSDRGELRGLVILPRPTWPALLFVDPDSFGSGIGRQLWEQARQYVVAVTPPVEIVTLNASTFAPGFYLKLGFVAAGKIEHQGRRGTCLTWRVRT